MVCEKEPSQSRWWWPLLRNAEKHSACNKGSAYPGVPRQGVQEWDALDMADSLEKGLVHESSEDFLRMLPELPGRLHRLRVVRSDDHLKYRLFREGREGSSALDFLMYAEVRSDVREVHFFLYDPADAASHKLFDPDRPAFIMTFDQCGDEWVLQHMQDRTWSSPRQMCQPPVPQRERVEVAVMQHSHVEVGDGVNHCLDVDIWARSAPFRCGPPSGPSAAEEGKIERLVTRQAVWNEELQMLTLDFRGRKVLPSAKNFQLALEDQPQRLVCQYGKIEKNAFALDCRAPLSTAQAFALSISTLRWE